SVSPCLRGRICSFLKLKNLYPIVPRIDRDDSPALVYAHAPRVRQSSRLSSRAAPYRFAPASSLIDLLHAVVAELADDQVAVLVHVQAVGETVLARGRAGSAHRAEEGAVGLEDIDAVVAG